MKAVAAALTWAATLAAAGSMAAPPVAAQERPELRVVREDGSMRSAPLHLERGFAAVEAALLESLGWSLEASRDSAAFTAPSGDRLILRQGTPLFSLGGRLLQAAYPPYAEDGTWHLPLQVVSDFLPGRYPERYAFDGPSLVLRAGPPPGAGGPVPSDTTPGSAAQPAAALPSTTPPDTLPATAAPGATTPPDTTPATAGPRRQPEVAPPEAGPEPEGANPDSLASEGGRRSSYTGPRVVVIDAGHGGYDPGSIGPRGVREKQVTLGVALALAERLGADPDLEVHLLRDDDTFVELWDRGQMATDLKGERPGVFVSIHANSFPARRSARGFETYFLSEARTDHERRVAAIENAPINVDPAAPGATDDLGFILRELRNLDHQHWSALLAEMVQEELGRFHPGPNRGVKQAPLAVITNALMPAVLVELGYLSNPREEQLLAQEDFQERAADALAAAIRRFFERYPPGGGAGGQTP